MSLDFVYLASTSPRRCELLRQIGVSFQVLGVSVDETPATREDPLGYVSRLALAKAEAGIRRNAEAGAVERPVLAADTAVIVGRQILGKPRDREDGLRMLALLSGRSHEVLTAVALASGSHRGSRLSRSEVTFRAIAPAEASDYWATGEPEDKAGGYAIQGLGAVFVEQLRGRFSGVMGLPLFETADLLRAAGVQGWRASMEGDAT